MAYNSDSRGGARSERPEGRSGGFGGGAGRPGADAAGGDAAMLVDEVLHGLACRAAIKAGDPLSREEVDALVRDRRMIRESHHCPHGRPTSLVLSRQDLDRQFRRT